MEENNIDVDDAEANSKHELHNVPFIAYLEGSYFGDVDILVNENVINFDRDSTAIAAEESHFFLLSRQSIYELKKNFSKEIIEMEDLASIRRAKHKRLIKSVQEKIEEI